MDEKTFEKASRMKVRYETPKGSLTVEDLWDLPLTGGSGLNLDKIAVTLSKQVKEESTESFVTATKENLTVETLHLKFDIVKHIISVKLAEREAAKTRAESQAKKDRILEIIAKKQDAALEGLELAELQKMVGELV